jgi:hypothetical protein
MWDVAYVMGMVTFLFFPYGYDDMAHVDRNTSSEDRQFVPQTAVEHKESASNEVSTVSVCQR